MARKVNLARLVPQACQNRPVFNLQHQFRISRKSRRPGRQRNYTIGRGKYHNHTNNKTSLQVREGPPGDPGMYHKFTQISTFLHNFNLLSSLFRPNWTRRSCKSSNLNTTYIKFSLASPDYQEEMALPARKESEISIYTFTINRKF
jgi:hypothetical protein